MGQMSKLFNPRLLSHPVNWLTVWSMLFMLLYVIHLLTHFINGTHPGGPVAVSAEGVAGPGTAVPENAFTA